MKVNKLSSGAKKLLKKYGGYRLAVAEAFLLGEIEPNEEPYISELVNEITLKAAHMRLNALGYLNSSDIKPVRKQ